MIVSVKPSKSPARLERVQQKGRQGLSFELGKAARPELYISSRDLTRVGVNSGLAGEARLTAHEGR